ncbi:hypothetical protein BDV06DRAFT_225110 [Aspergillus oleicola]
MTAQASIEYVSVFRVQYHDAGRIGHLGLATKEARADALDSPSNLEHILGPCSVQIITQDKEHDSTQVTAHALPRVVLDDTLSQKTVAAGNYDGAPQIILETPEGDDFFVHESAPNRFKLQKPYESQKSNDQETATLKPRMANPVNPETVFGSSVISLTWGDFGDHRVSVSGSCFAFIFMLKMYQHRQYTLKSTSDSERTMDQDTKLPQQPPQVHATGPPSSSHDLEAQPKYPIEKNPLKTWSQVAQEWKYGSKSRVVTHLLMYFLIGFIVGAIIGVIIGVCVNYA